MAFNTLAVAEYLVDTLTGIGVSVAQLGAPESTGQRLAAYVTAGSQSIRRQTTGTTRREARFFVSLAYRVDNNEATAESTLMTSLDAFLAEIYADLTLGGTALSTEVDTSLADTPEYAMRAGKEFREFPILITAVQQGAFSPNP